MLADSYVLVDIWCELFTIQSPCLYARLSDWFWLSVCLFLCLSVICRDVSRPDCLCYLFAYLTVSVIYLPI